MKPFFGQVLCVALFIVIFETATGELSPSNSPNTFSSIVQPSPTINSNSTTKHNTSTVHPSNSSTVHPSNSSTTHHNHSSTAHHNHSSTAHHNHSSTIHHNHSSTAHHNYSSTIHHNVTSSIMPSPSINFSISINMTTATRNASHMTYTISPTHSISPNTTSTVTPSSSSIAPTTPVPPKWPTGKFSVKKGNDSCLLMWLSLEFTVKYKNVSSGEMINHDVIMPNASSAHATGTCSIGMSSIKIAWGFYYLEATFMTAHMKNAGVHWEASNLTMYAQVTNNSAFVDANTTIREIKETLTESDVRWLSGYDGHSFNCSTKVQVKSEHITATFENLRIEPFGVKHNEFSKNVDVCNVSPTTPVPTTKPTQKKPNSNTVAIAVGCSLGGLVLIVLIGYFIGKRRKNSIRYRKL